MSNIVVECCGSEVCEVQNDHTCFFVADHLWYKNGVMYRFWASHAAEQWAFGHLIDHALRNRVLGGYDDFARV